jgi:hypothetical protein
VKILKLLHCREDVRSAVQHRQQKDGALAAEISLCTTKVIKNRPSSYKKYQSKRGEERKLTWRCG